MTHVRSRFPRLAPVLVAAVAVTTLGAPRGRAEEDAASLRRTAVVRAVEKTRDAVVPIHTTQVIRRQWFGIEFPPVHGSGVGSGVVFHPDGYVITNAHVVARASKILIDVTPLGEEEQTLEGRIFAVDLSEDLAILRIVAPAGTRFPHLPIGGTQDLMLGEPVIALGNPFELGFTVTTGVVSGVGRKIPFGDGRKTFSDYLQTDAAVNPGNSGGPLLDITGRWIGVNTVVYDPRIADGIGFAIPAERVRGLVARAFTRRHIRGDWLGLALEAGDQGEAVVQYAFPKGPSAVAGIREGDRIEALDGVPTPTLFDLRWRLASLDYGAVLRLGVRSPGEADARVVAVTLLPVPTNALSDRHLGFVGSDVGERENLDRQLAFDAGVIVREVRRGGPAARIGLREGDVVVGLGNRQIRNSDDLLTFLQYVRPGDIVLVRVLRERAGPDGLPLRDLTQGTLIAE